MESWLGQPSSSSVVWRGGCEKGGGWRWGNIWPWPKLYLWLSIVVDLHGEKNMGEVATNHGWGCKHHSLQAAIISKRPFSQGTCLSATLPQSAKLAALTLALFSVGILHLEAFLHCFRNILTGWQQILASACQCGTVLVLPHASYSPLQLR